MEAVLAPALDLCICTGRARDRAKCTCMDTDMGMGMGRDTPTFRLGMTVWTTRSIMLPHRLEPGKMGCLDTDRDRDRDRGVSSVLRFLGCCPWVLTLTAAPREVPLLRISWVGEGMLVGAGEQ